MPWDPDEGVLLIMILLPAVSLTCQVISWAQAARQREEEESGGGPWDAEAQRGRDQEEEDSIKQHARLAAEQWQGQNDLPPAWLRWLPPWAYKSLARTVGHRRLGLLQARDAELSEIMLGMHRRLRRMSAEMAATQAGSRQRGYEGRSRVYRALVEEKEQLEKEQQAREASIVAEREAQLEAARSREHDALEQAEAQWRHTHHGAMTRKEQQVHVEAALVASELSEAEVERGLMSQELERQTAVTAGLETRVAEQAQQLATAAAEGEAARAAEVEAKQREERVAAALTMLEAERATGEARWQGERAALEDARQLGEDRLASARRRHDEHEGAMAARLAELEAAHGAKTALERSLDSARAKLQRPAEPQPQSQAPQAPKLASRVSEEEIDQYRVRADRRRQEVAVARATAEAAVVAAAAEAIATGKP